MGQAAEDQDAGGAIAVARVPGGPSHLAPPVREVLGWSREDRIAYAMTNRWINHTRAAEALKALSDLMAAPRTAPAPGLLLCGQSGSGKSTILDRFRAAHPATSRVDGQTSCPVLAMEVPTDPTETRFWTALLTAAGIAHRDTAPVLRKMQQATSILAYLQVRLLIIDEFHNVLLGQPRHQRQLLALIRSLSNPPLLIPMVLAGTEAAVRAIQTDDQLERRFDDFVLPRWTEGDGYRRLLRGFERLLPLAEPSGLDGDDMARVLHAKSGPTIGGLARVLKRLAVLAIEDGRERIDLAMVKAVEGFGKEERGMRARRL